MAINLKISAVGTREDRLGSITGYSGDLHDIVEKSKCGVSCDNAGQAFNIINELYSKEEANYAKNLYIL